MSNMPIATVCSKTPEQNCKADCPTPGSDAIASRYRVIFQSKETHHLHVGTQRKDFLFNAWDICYLEDLC